MTINTTDVGERTNSYAPALMALPDVMQLL